MKRLLLIVLVLSAARVYGPTLVRASSDEASTEISIAAADDASDLDQPFRPSVIFRLQPGGDVAMLSGRPEFPEGIQRWQIQIFDFNDQKVDFIQGVGAPTSEAIRWDGVERDGTLLRDGYYAVRFVWVDRAGATRRSDTIKVGLLTPPGPQDLLGPQVSLVYARGHMTIRFAEEMAFAPGEFELRREAFETLRRTSDFLQRYPKNRLLVLGHTDSTGADPANLALSRKRAEVIYRFLIAHGIDAENLAYQGVGSAQPVTSNVTPEGRKQNRRIEIRVLKT